MRYVIVGAGAIGGTLGAQLHGSGAEVHLVARGEHARVIASDGLTYRTPSSSSVLRIPVSDGLDGVRLRDDDVLVMATKTQDSLQLLQSLAAATTETGRPGSSLPVVCAQNGVENERLAARRFEHVYGVCVMLPATRLEPGVVLANGTPYPGMLDLGCWPTGVDATVSAVVADLVTAGFVSVAEPAVMRWKYAKLLRNLGNAIQALTGRDVEEAYKPVRAEAVAVLDAAGIDVTPGEEWAERRGHQVETGDIAGQRRGGGSSWQSLTKGTGTIESDYLNGEIVYVAHSVGLQAPRNALLQRLANEAAAMGAKPGDLAADELVRRLDACDG